MPLLHVAHALLHAATSSHVLPPCPRAQGEIAVHWTYLEPFLAGRGMPAERIDRLRSALTAKSVTYRTVRSAVAWVVKGMGRSMREVGEPNLTRMTEGWGCAASKLRGIA